MVERPDAKARVDAARLAMAIYRDRLNDAQGAAAAITKLLEEEPADAEALQMLLTTRLADGVRLRLLKAGRAALVQRLADVPDDAATVRLLVDVAAALGDDALQQAALGALLSLGGGDARSEPVFNQLASRKERTPQVAVSSTVLKAILAPGDGGPVADLFAALGPTLAEALGPSLQACGVGRRDKVDPRSGLALRNEIAAWAGALGIHEFDLYVGGKDPLGVQGIPGEPPALVVGSGVNAPLSSLSRARVARELLGILRGTTVTRSRDETTVAAIVVAACKLAEVRIDHPAYPVLAEVERLVGKAISRKTRKALPEFCNPSSPRAGPTPGRGAPAPSRRRTGWRWWRAGIPRRCSRTSGRSAPTSWAARCATIRTPKTCCASSFRTSTSRLRRALGLERGGRS